MSSSAALADPPPNLERTSAPRAAARDTRRQAILAIARDAFMEQGYAAASMSAIAARLGGSKGTLYNYFSSKEDLFAAVVADECEAEFAFMALFEPTDGVEESLRRFGGRFMRFVLSDKALAFHRLISSEVVRFPELGRLFYDAGPERTLARVAAFLSERMEAGELRRADPVRAASSLIGLLKANLHHRRVWNVLGALDDAAIDAHVAGAVEGFLHGFAVG